jgi:hypothetical protein
MPMASESEGSNLLRDKREKEQKLTGSMELFKTFWAVVPLRCSALENAVGSWRCYCRSAKCVSPRYGACVPMDENEYAPRDMLVHWSDSLRSRLDSVRSCGLPHSLLHVRPLLASDPRCSCTELRRSDVMAVRCMMLGG